MNFSKTSVIFVSILERMLSWYSNSTSKSMLLMWRLFREGLQLSERWLYASSIIRIGLALRVKLSRTLKHLLVLKLPVIASGRVQCYGFQHFISGVVRRFRHRYILQTVTAGIPPTNVAYFQIKIQLSGFSSNPGGSPPQLILISGGSSTVYKSKFTPNTIPLKTTTHFPSLYLLHFPTFPLACNEHLTQGPGSIA